MIAVHDMVILLLLGTMFPLMAHAQSGRATVDVRVHSYRNPTHTDINGNCCDGSPSASPCTDMCDNFFTVCLQDYNEFSRIFFASDSCPHGRTSTELIAENDDDLTFTSMFPNGDSNVITHVIDDYPSLQGRVQVAFRAQDLDGRYIDADAVIGTVFINLDASNAYPGDGYTTPAVYEGGGASNMEVEISFQVSCAENYYGPTCETLCVPINESSICERDETLVCVENYYGPTCNVFCQDSDDMTGHYYCDDDGNRVCLDGYQNPSTNCVDCVPAEGCSTFGFCEEPFECRCLPGYDGTNCTIDLDLCGQQQPCQNNATCINKGLDMYQCVCVEEYEGENCTTLIKTDECDPNLCQNGGKCIDLLKDFMCNCPYGFSGKECQLSLKVWLVVGGVVGGLTILVVFTLLSVLLWKRCRKKSVKVNSKDCSHSGDYNQCVLSARPNGAYGIINGGNMTRMSFDNGREREYSIEDECLSDGEYAYETCVAVECNIAYGIKSMTTCDTEDNVLSVRPNEAYAINGSKSGLSFSSDIERDCSMEDQCLPDKGGDCDDDESFAV